MGDQPRLRRVRDSPLNTAAIAATSRTTNESGARIFGGVTAQDFLDRTALRPGAAVVVNGGSGAVGTAAIQLAKRLGAHVTAVCQKSQTDDAIMDCVGNAPFARVSTSIEDGGTLLLVVADPKSILGASRASRTTGKLVSVSAVD